MDLGRAECRRDRVGRHHARQAVRPAKCGGVAAAEQLRAARPQAVGADQRDAVLLAGVAAAQRLHGDAVAVRREIVDRGAEPERDVGIARARREQRRLQVGAVDRPSRVRRSAARPSSPSGMRAISAPCAVSIATASGATTAGASRSARPSAIRTRVALGESWMPAPVSSSRRPVEQDDAEAARASASAAVSPPMPAPAMRTLREDATARAPGGSGRSRSGHTPPAAPRADERGIVTVERRAIRADDLVVAAHVEEHMGMVERRRRADAHEFARPDLDHRHAGVVVEMGNDLSAMGTASIAVDSWRGAT